MSKPEPTQLKHVRYSPESGARSPVKLVTGLFAEMYNTRELAWRLFVRNISAQYRQTLFGYVWVILPPLAMSAVWVFLNSTKIISVPDTEIPYPLFAFAGNLLWQSFGLALGRPLMSVQKEKALLTKLNFSREAVLTAGFIEALFTGFLQLLIFVPLLFIFKVDLTWHLLLAPLGMLLMVLFGYSLGTLLTPPGLLFQDIGRAIPIATRFLFFFTPVIYPPPTKFPAAIINYVNPIAPIIVTARNWMTGQAEGLPPTFLPMVGAMLIVLGFGLLFYRLAMPHIIERMSA